MKKNCIVILVLVFISCLCSAQDVKWQVVEETEAYTSDGMSKYFLQTNFPVSTILTPTTTSRYSRRDGIYDIVMRANYENKNYYINAEAVIPYGTKDLLPESLLTPTLRKNGKDWFSSIYLDILYSGDRNTALKYSPKGIEAYEITRDEYEGPWWNSSASGNVYDPAELFQTVLSINNFFNYADLYIINIEKHEDNIVLALKVDIMRLRDSPTPGVVQPLQGYEKNKELILILKQDGDYLNIFAEGDILIGSYVQMDRSFANLFLNFIKTNDLPDLSEITWPRHADGSCDYDDKRIITVQQDSRYRTIDNLRLRSAEETTSDILSTLEKGTIVSVLSLGKEDSIDGIQSNWVKVQLEDGTIGWCFGGYLSTTPIEVPSSYKSNQPKGSNQNTDIITTASAGVSTTTLIVGGGVLVLLLGAGIFLLLKRKK